MPRPQEIRLAYPRECVEARALLLWDSAPGTCEGVLGSLPVQGQAHHGIYSGSECVLLLPEVLKLPPENATSKVRKGQVAFTWMAGGSAYGVEKDFAEICWFYDIDAEPRMWGGPVEVSVFAKIIEPADDFYEVGFRMRREGVKPFQVSVVADTERDGS